jgi:hypothetical protein
MSSGACGRRHKQTRSRPRLALNAPTVRRVVRFPLIYAKAIVSATAPLVPVSRASGRGQPDTGRAPGSVLLPIVRSAEHRPGAARARSWGRAPARVNWRFREKGGASRGLEQRPASDEAGVWAAVRRALPPRPAEAGVCRPRSTRSEVSGKPGTLLCRAPLSLNPPVRWVVGSFRGDWWVDGGRAVLWVGILLRVVRWSRLGVSRWPSGALSGVPAVRVLCAVAMVVFVVAHAAA